MSRPHGLGPTRRARTTAGALALTIAATAGLGVGVDRATAAAAKPPTIAVSGSPTALPLVADLAYFYRQTRKQPPVFSFVAGGSGAGVFDASRGVTDIGLVTRGREPTDPPEVAFSPFARSAVCVVTNKANPVANLSRAQIAQLLDGATARWADVTGAGDAPIVGATLAVGNGGDSVFLSRFVDLATPITFQPRTFATPSQLRAFVAATPNAWGYVDLAFAGGLHAVPFQGVACDRGTVSSRAYPGTYDLSFVTRARPSRATARFIRWVRTSKVARRAIQMRFVSVG